ncbi:MAG: helix-turn-helix domain-containing protein [Alphaproteobacteria bacterium]|nr:helix-turn-helix domain-containing protein [Alphaproteobacteria bacterium]
MTKAADEILAGINDAIAMQRGAESRGRFRKILNVDIDVKEIRSATGLSQSEFADTYLLSLSTLQKWEAGTRTPEGPAKTLLYMIAQDPSYVRDTLEQV